MAYVDIDVHHGDGVQAAFYATDHVLTISLHQAKDALKRIDDKLAGSTEWVLQMWEDAMNGRELFRFIVGFLKDILLIDAVIFVGAALLFWVFGGRTVDQYGQWLMWVGIAAVVIGAMGFVGGGATSRGSVDYQLGQSAGQEDMGGRATQLVKDLAQSYAFTIRTTAVGIIALGVGVLLQEFFG